MEQVLATLQEAAITITCAGITALAAYAVAYLVKLRKRAEIEITKVDNENTQIYLKNILDTTYDTLSICIDKLEVTMVKNLKKANEDGKLTREDGKKVASEAVKLFYEIVDKDIAAGLANIVGDTEKYLLTLVDSMVLNKKTELLKSGVNPGVTTGDVPVETAMLNS